MSTFNDVKNQAKELGIRYVGVSKADLEKAIAEKLGNSNNKEAKKVKEDSFNAVLVYVDEKHPIRTYSKEVHGQEFAELATEFASKKNYQTKFITE